VVTGEVAATARRLPGTVWALGLVSLFMDTSSELIHALLPVFVVGTLGAGALVLGIIEGTAEATATVLKAFSGALSDAIGRRKPLVVAGYGLAALTKPLFALAGGPGLVFAARLLDRVGKGVRGAPRDALVADVTPAELRGAAFGLRQGLDTVGALLGPLLAVALMLLLGGDIRAVFWVAVVPAALAVLVLVAGVREPAAAPRREGAARLPRLAEARRLGRPFWLFLGFAVLLSLGRLGEAFLVLRGAETGLSPALAPLALAAMNATYAVTSYPFGHLSDRLGRRGLVGLGFAVLAAAQAVLAFAGGPALVLLGAAVWGLHLGMTQGVMSALVADLAPPSLRGTAFGLFHAATGLALLIGGIASGLLWQFLGGTVAFAAGAAVVGLAALGFAVSGR
jgi:MFS family permease